MSYKNINSILRERKDRVLITGAESGKVNMSRLPDDGEVVGIETDFAEYIEVKIHSTSNFGNTCHGATKHHVVKGSEIIIDDGELIEFSHSKIYAIHRK